MQQVEDKIETIHLYVVREEEKRPFTLLPLTCAFLCLVGIAALILYSGQHPYYEHKTLTIPAHFFFQNFEISEPVIPTGSKTYPATTAHGILTLTNGSVITQELPQGMIFIGSGVEVVTDEAVLVPAGSAEGFGIATVPAHSLLLGKKGNIATLSINQVYGTSLFIRNLQSFSGGKDSYSVQIVTQQDRQTAINAARAFLTAQVARRRDILASPCKESLQEVHAVIFTWTCQFVAYPKLPNMTVTRVKIRGKNLLVDVQFVARPYIMRFR